MSAGPPPTVIRGDESADELYERAPCGYVTATPDGLLLRVNQTFVQWLGHAREELVRTQRLQELLPIGNQIFFETHLAPLLRMQGYLSEVQLDLRRKDGTQLPVLLNAVLDRDHDGTPALLRITVFNIEERKRFEQELVIARKRAEAAAEAKAEFLSMMSHEIRTPLSAIIGIAGLLRRTELTPQQQKYVRILGSSSDNLLTLLNNILDFAKLDSGKAGLDRRAFDLPHLVYSALYTFSVKGEEKRLDLAVDLAEDVPRFVVGDPVKLGQVLNNLVSNAIKFTEKGGVTIVVRCLERVADQARIQFSVRDTGIGIAAERLRAVFEPFVQADFEIGLRFGGTGLGLAISRKILELHRSRMEISSTEGVGTTMSFVLELPVANAPEPEAVLARELTADLHTFRFLVAEDNAVNVFMMREFLSAWNTQPVVVSNGREAVEAVERERFDVVLMDLRMPEMDGVEAVRRIRALPDPAKSAIPVIAVTASERTELGERMHEAGFTDVLGKPFKPEHLLARLMKFVPGVAEFVRR